MDKPASPPAILPGLPGGAPVHLKRVEVFQATVRLQSKREVQMICPADMTDQDVLDLIMEISKNLPEAARKRSVTSRLVVANGPLSSKS